MSKLSISVFISIICYCVFGAIEPPDIFSENVSASTNEKGGDSVKPNVVLFAVHSLKQELKFSYDEAPSEESSSHREEVDKSTLSLLANQGIILDSFYSSPMSVPSRQALLSGRINCQPNNEEICNDMDHSLPSKLKQLGYYTLAIGAWQSTTNNAASNVMMRKGFEEHFEVIPSSYVSGSDSASLKESFGKSCTTKENYDSTKQEYPYIGFELRCTEIDTTTTAIPSSSPSYSFASDFIEKGKLDLYTATAVSKLSALKNEKPFFLHQAYQVSQFANYSALYQVKDKAGDNDDASQLNLGRKCEVMRVIDESVSMLVSHLKSTKQWQNTLFIFTSSRATSSGSDTMDGGALYKESSIRAPAFLGGGYIENKLNLLGRTTMRSKLLFHAADIYPTIMSILIEGDHSNSVVETSEMMLDSPDIILAAGQPHKVFGELEGVSQWNLLLAEMTDHNATKTHEKKHDKYMTSVYSKRVIKERSRSYMFDGYVRIGKYKLLVNTVSSKKIDSKSRSLDSAVELIPKYRLFDLEANPNELESETDCEMFESCHSLFHVKEYDRIKKVLLVEFLRSVPAAASIGADVVDTAMSSTAKKIPFLSAAFQKSSSIQSTSSSLSSGSNIGSIKGHVSNNDPIERTANEEDARNSRKLVLSNYDILSTLYSNNGGSSWFLKSGWMSSTSNPCPTGNWYGVTCSSSNVIGLDLAGNNVQFSLPSEVGQFTALTQFSFYSNTLTGSLPSQLGLFTRMLTLLEVDTNSLTGQIPSELGLWSRFNSGFYLNGNLFSGSLPSELGLLTSLLSGLYIYNNPNLVGSLPSQLGQLSKLSSVLALFSMRLSGSLPSQLGQLTGLTASAYLHQNSFTASIPSQLGSLSRMNYEFYLSSNKFTSSIPSELGKLSFLTAKFYLETNSLSHSLPSEIGQFSKLTASFFMNGNQLSNSLPSELGQLSKLSANFFLNSNRFSNSMPSELGQLSLLSSFFSLYSNSFSGLIPSELGQLTAMSNYVYLHQNSLTGTIPSELGHLTALTSGFFLYSNSLTGSLPSELGSFTAFTSSYYLFSNQLCADIPYEIVYMLVTQVSAYNVNTANSLGTPCCKSLPFTYTCQPTAVPTPSPSLPPSPLPTSEPTSVPTYLPSPLPTISLLPSPVPTPFPSFQPSPLPTILPSPIPSSTPSPLPTTLPTLIPSPLPTSTPTVYCVAGTYYDGLECVACAIGYYSNFSRPPYPSSCSSCPAGQYNTQSGLSECTACAPGKLSSPDRTYCSDCQAGEYNYNDEECVQCEAGKYAPQALSDSCLVCGAGFQTNNNTGATSCISCTAGFYSNGMATFCLSCPAGRWSSYSAPWCENCSLGTYAEYSGSTTCLSCAAGTYADERGLVSCKDCSIGQYQSSTGQSGCVDCSASTYAEETGAILCANCPLKYYSEVGAKECKLASEGYYLLYRQENGDSQRISEECPHTAECAGGDYAPAPKRGYWVDRSSYDYVSNIYSCPRLTCKGSAPNNTCWSYSGYYNHSSLLSESGHDDEEIRCQMDELLCTEGAYGPLCGSCEVGYVFRGETKTCSPCSSAKRFALTALGVGGGCIILIIILVSGYQSDNRVTQFLKSVDSGSLKVLWVTYQIIMSVSWNLDIEFPKIFSRMLSLLSVFSLDILSLECFQTQSDDRFYVTVYLWCCIPVIFALVIVVSGLFRVTIFASNYKSRTKVINQHVWLLLLLSYLVLPPVAMKQLQSLDCIPFSHDNSSYLRADTGVNCQSHDYLVFKVWIILFFAIYQLIPVIWMMLLYRHRSVLYIPQTVNDLDLRLNERDNLTELSHIKFLFKDYKGEKWWFEVAEMYRRIMFIGVLPLFTPIASKRASLGCIFAILSIIYFREEEPFRVEFTNTIAYIAQFTILLTYYAALSIETGAMIGFGLGDFGIGVFLILINVCVVLLVLFLAFKRFDRLRSEMHWRRGLTSQEFRVVNLIMEEEEGYYINDGSFNQYDPDKDVNYAENEFQEGSFLGEEEGGILYDKETSDNDRASILNKAAGGGGGGDIELKDMHKYAKANQKGNPSSNKSDRRKRSLANDLLSQYLLQPKEVVMTKRIGAGAFGEVFKGVCMGEPVAVKTMLDITEQNVREFRAEILLTASLRHPNIVNFVGACWSRELMCLVLEWVARGTLRDFLSTPQGMDLRWDDPLLRLATDIARGMNYLHNRKYYDELNKESKECILHRDLKPDNALVSDYIAAKIADFGTSRSKAGPDVMMTAIGTPLYVAPEIARGEYYDEKVDVYSFGLTLADMSVEDILQFIGERYVQAFKKKKVPTQSTRMIRPMTEDGWRPVTAENPIPFAPPSINDLIIRCCSHEPSQRPSFAEILEEFNGKCKEEIEAKTFGRKFRPRSEEAVELIQESGEHSKDASKINSSKRNVNNEEVLDSDEVEMALSSLNSKVKTTLLTKKGSGRERKVSIGQDMDYVFSEPSSAPSAMFDTHEPLNEAAQRVTSSSSSFASFSTKHFTSSLLRLSSGQVPPNPPPSASSGNVEGDEESTILRESWVQNPTFRMFGERTGNSNNNGASVSNKKSSLKKGSTVSLQDTSEDGISTSDRDVVRKGVSFNTSTDVLSTKIIQKRTADDDVLSASNSTII